MKTTLGARLSSGIAALDKLLGHQRGDSEKRGFHIPSTVLLTGEPGVGKTTLLFSILSLWSIPNLTLGGGVVSLSVPIIKMMADHALTGPANVLILDGPEVTADEVHSLHADNRLVILVHHARVLKAELRHTVSVHLHMAHKGFRTTLSCKEKNRFGEHFGSIFKLKGSTIWRSE